MRQMRTSKRCSGDRFLRAPSQQRETPLEWILFPSNSKKGGRDAWNHPGDPDPRLGDVDECDGRMTRAVEVGRHRKARRRTSEEVDAKRMGA